MIFFIIALCLITILIAYLLTMIEKYREILKHIIEDLISCENQIKELTKQYNKIYNYLTKVDDLTKRENLFEETVRSALNHYEKEIHILLEKE